MKKNEITTSYIVMFIITIVCVVAFLSSVSYYQVQDLQNRIIISDLTNNLTELQKVQEDTYRMKLWYTDTYKQCVKGLEDEIERCPELRILHPTKVELTMETPIRVEHWIKGGFGELNSTVIYYNPNKVQHVFSDNRYYAIFTTNLSECDFP